MFPAQSECRLCRRLSRKQQQYGVPAGHRCLSSNWVEEDAKITYMKPVPEQRMNGTCAGGTGAFIDQMAQLLQTDAAGLDHLASKSTQLYPIASRCGVFAKTDLQPLLNEGASRADLAASVLQAVVTQTIAGLACGRPIRGHVVLLGGPLHYLASLRDAFIRTLAAQTNLHCHATRRATFCRTGGGKTRARRSDSAFRHRGPVPKRLQPGAGCRPYAAAVYRRC